MKYHIDTQNTRTIKYGGKTRILGRIIADRDIINPNLANPILKGQFGGYVEICPEKTILSQDGECWIGRGCVVLETCYVGGDALICGESKLLKNTYVINNGVVDDSVCEAAIRASIAASAVVYRSVINGDLNMMGSSSLRNCEHQKGYLRMEDESKLSNCVIQARERGIALKNRQSLSQKLIVGNGYIDDQHVQITMLEKNK